MTTLESFLKYPLVFFSALGATFFLVPTVRNLASALGVVDVPDERRLHRGRVPRGGGIAIFFGFHLACAVIYLLPWRPFYGKLDYAWWQNFLGLSSLILLVGLLDDIFGLRAGIKLLGQLIVATLVYMSGIGIGTPLDYELPYWADYPLTMLWILGITNAINLIDGLDGLATGLVCIASAGLIGALLLRAHPGDALVLIGLMGACFAFLRFNFHPATIFLGDSGSLFLGLTLSVIALSTGSKGTALATLGVPLLAIGVPIFDTLLALWRRSIRKLLRTSVHPTRGGGVLKADKEHLHHRLVSLGLTQRRVAIILYTANAFLVALGLAGLIYQSSGIGIFLAAFVVGSYVIVRHIVHVELWDSGELILRGIRRPECGVVTALAYPVVDFVLLSLSFSVALFLTYPELGKAELKELLREQLPITLAACFIALSAVGTYSRIWSRARVSDFVLLSGAVLGGVLLAAAWEALGQDSVPYRDAIKLLLYFFFSVGFLVGIRAVPRVVEDLLSYLANQPRYPESAIDKVVIIGARDGCISYLRQIGRSADVQIRGLIALEPSLRKRRVYGYRVLGWIDELPELLAAEEIDELVLTEPLSEERLESILAWAGSAGLRVTRWEHVAKELYDPAQEESYTRWQKTA